ncbi:DNA repair protein rad14 [Yamadazyma tenuis]|uniref:DNA repair protein n=1 Tax=Candida tenuis (strain ATCC 10573 / BCRC 21748 / CBS 615 / JCM 9827 / NBRC 10315 / NRRL Y-1498 / VKM Y-70) TaxID=590646 RepID=G3AY05_CANTC|nr:DNA repair protein [Yamadazyma tenuis ATCC 10573]EGV65739.1 DNA repair protein [Yamadazyma tenuis ATCC 10573]WEJ95943.1 DNA repair protein rad14 [Yamadazyma tenuis]
MSFVKGTLSDAQRQRIEANRRRALERLQKKGLRDQTVVSSIDPTIVADSGNSISVDTHNQTTGSTIDLSQKKQKVELTPEQRKRIEQNRKKALEIRENLQKNHRDATDHTIPTLPVPDALVQQEQAKKKSEVIKPMNRKRDYIDYDFSTMKDTHGGFMDDPSGDEDALINQSLEDWKERQKRELIVHDLAPPLDIASAPKCVECESLEIDPNYYSNFKQTRVCRRCAKEKPEKYSLLTKTECKEDYLLTEPELQDINLLPRIEKPNPHGYSRMQLFLRLQVEEFAVKKWGSLENLDKEWERREEMRLKRKDKKYKDKLKEMRRKTRAEEYTTKLRNGKSLNDKHVHDWAQPIPFVKDDMNFVKKRCIDCGIEVEEVKL